MARKHRERHRAAPPPNLFPNHHSGRKQLGQRRWKWDGDVDAQAPPPAISRRKSVKVVPEEDGMESTDPTPDRAETAFWSWLGFWMQLLILGVLAIIGAFFASAASRPGNYACGIILSGAAIALAFLRLKHRLDRGNSNPENLFLVGDMWNLALVIPLFAVIGLAGMFVAHAWESGALHIAGVALFIVSGLLIFLNIKHVFDRMDAERH